MSLGLVAWLWGATASLAQVQDPFALRPPLTDYAAFSCQALVVDGNSEVSSKGMPAGSRPTNLGHVRANQGIVVKGNGKVIGNATPGPGYQVVRQGNGTVTGSTSQASQVLDCHPIDLVALKAALLAANDNGSIPRTSRNKVPLGGADGRELTVTSNDTLAVPAGTFLFSKMTVSANAKITLGGAVRILCFGNVSISANSEVNAQITPYRLRLWVSGNQVSIDSNAKMNGYIYAPEAPVALQANGDYYGAVFGKSVTLAGNAKLRRPIDDMVPTVTISSPAEGQAVPACSVQVSGLISDAETAVTLAVNGAAVAVQPNGSFQTTVDLTPATGGLIIATAVDQGGNSKTVERHVVPPAPSVALVTPPSGSLVGQSVVDLAGTVSPETTVTVNGTPALLPSAGTWFLQGLALGSDGMKTLGIVAQSCGGTAPLSASLDVDTVPPSIGIDTPASGSSTTDPTVTVAGPVADAHLASVTLAVNGAPSGPIVTVDGGRFSAANVPLAMGANQIVATATDQLGRATPVAVSVTRESGDIEGPFVTITQPALQTGACLVAGQPVTVSGTYSDASPANGQGGQPQPVVVEVLPAGGAPTAVSAVLAEDGHSWSAAGVDVGSADGTAVITAVASDSLGHTTRLSRSFPLDAAAPTLQLTLDGAPFPGQASGEAPPAGTQPVLLGRAVSARVTITDAPATPQATPQLSLDGAAYQAGTLIDAEGQHLVVARVTDCAGRQVAVHSLFRLDLAAPALLSTAPAEGATLTEGPAGFSGTSDPDLAKAVINGVEAQVAGGTFSLTPVAWAEGLNRVDVVLEDQAGHRSTYLRTYSVRSVALSVQIIESGLPIANGAVFTRAVTPEVRVNDSQARVAARLNGSDYDPGSPIDATGTYVLQVTATDAQGRSASAAASFHVDLQTPPTIEITSPADGAELPSAQITASGTATGDTPHVTVNGVDAALDGGTWTVALTLDPDVLNTLAATVVDRRGRTAQDVLTVMVRSGGPKVVITEPAEGVLTNRAAIDVAGAVLGGPSAVPSGAVTVRGVSAALDSSGAFRVLDVPLQEGANVLGVQATDAQGRIGQATVTVTCDRTPPAVLVLAEGQPLHDGATFSQAVALRVEIGDGSAFARPPLVRLDGDVLPVTAGAVEATASTDGGHFLDIVVADAAGNESRLTRGFTVALGGCAISDLQPASGSTVAVSSVTVRGRAGSASAVRIVISGTPPQELTAQLADGTFVAADLPLAVLGENTLSVVCVDQTGQTHSEPLVIRRLADDEGPQVTIAAPSSGTWTAANAVTVTGTVSDPSAPVTVNGVKTAAPSNGTFRLDALTLAEGPNVVVAQATDLAGRWGRDRVVVWRDSQAPRLGITSPEPRTVVGVAPGGQTNVDVSGQVDLSTEPNLTSVVVASAIGSVMATVDPATGVFVAAGVPLDPQVGSGVQQTITTTASDSLGHVGTASTSVLLDADGPAIVLAAPIDLSFVTDPALIGGPVAGEAWGADGSSIAINGVLLDPTTLEWDAAGPDGRRHVAFTATAEVPTGDGPFAVVARCSDQAGASAQSRRTLVRDTRAPQVVEVVPTAGSTGVDRDTQVLVLFSEAVRPPSLSTADGLRVVRVSSGEAVAGQVALAGQAVAFVPASALTPGESYRVELGAGVLDVAGNPLLPPAPVTFTVALAGTGAPPQLDALPPVTCATEITVSGTASPNARLRVADGGLRFTTTADATGHFGQVLPLSVNGYHLLRVVEVDRGGSPVGRETVAVVRLDCSAPTVGVATLDRATGVLRIVFSERIGTTSLTFGGADSSLRLSDAESGQLGTGVLSLPTDGRTAEIQLPVAPSAWWVDRPVRLWVGPTVQDERGNAMGAPFETVFAASGQEGLAGAFLSGETFDDRTGRPLSGVSALLFSSQSALPGTVTGSVPAPATGEVLTDGRGRYTITDEVAAGRYVLVLERDGYTRVVRRLALEPAVGAVPFDARLTPVAAPAGTLDPTQGGVVESGAMRLEVSAAAVPGSVPLAVRLTAVGEQGLPDFLPLGWTPTDAAEVRLEVAGAPLPEGLGTPFAAEAVHLTVPLPAWVQAGDALIGVRYDLAVGAWLVLPPVERLTGTDGAATARLALPGPGTVAVVRADEDPATAPPPAGAAGTVLRGVAQPEVVPPMTATLALDPPVVAPTGRATARVVARSADSITGWPSGLAVQALLDERLVVAGGGELREAPFGSDLVLYHPRLDASEVGSSAPGGVGEVRFAVSPSPRAAQVLLEVGWENIRLFPFPEQISVGSSSARPGVRSCHPRESRSHFQKAPCPPRPWSPQTC